VYVEGPKPYEGWLHSLPHLRCSQWQIGRRITSLGTIPSGSLGPIQLEGRVQNNLPRAVRGVTLRLAAIHPKYGLIRRCAHPTVLVPDALDAGGEAPFNVLATVDTRGDLPQGPGGIIGQTRFTWGWGDRPVEAWCHLDWPQETDIVVSWQRPLSVSQERIEEATDAIIDHWNLCALGKPRFEEVE